MGGDGARVSCSDGSAARLAWPAAAGGGSGGALGSRGGGALSWAPPSATGSSSGSCRVNPTPVNCPVHLVVWAHPLRYWCWPTLVSHVLQMRW